MTSKDLQAIFLSISSKINSNKDYLTALDQISGDGDLGITASNGFLSVISYLNQNTETDLGKIFNKCGDAFNEAAPSSLGTILTFFMKGMARILKGAKEANVELIAHAMREGLNNITAKAGSKAGEKTIIDSLEPAIAYLERSGAEAKFSAAAVEARKGSESTKNMKAVWGRAAYYGEKSVGNVDGGSVVGALIFEGIEDYCAHLME